MAIIDRGRSRTCYTEVMGLVSYRCFTLSSTPQSMDIKSHAGSTMYKMLTLIHKCRHFAAFYFLNPLSYHSLVLSVIRLE